MCVYAKVRVQMGARRGDSCNLERGVWQCVSVLSEWGPLHIKRGQTEKTWGETTASTERVWDIFKATGKTFLLTTTLKKKEEEKKKKAPTLIHINTRAKSVGMLRKCQTCLLSFLFISAPIPKHLLCRSCGRSPTHVPQIGTERHRVSGN